MTTVNAANQAYDIALISNQTDLTPGKEIEVTLKLKNFQNINTNLDVNEFVKWPKI